MTRDVSSLNGIRAQSLDEHFKAIAALLNQAKPRLWRTSWRVEVDGCVYKFKVEGYAKKSSAAWLEQERENGEALAEFQKEHKK